MLNILKKTLLITVSVMFMAAPAFATEWTVDAAGSDPDFFLDLTTAFATLDGYVGDHNIVILEGDYSDEGLWVPANITSVVGEGKDLVTFTGGGSDFFLRLDLAPTDFVLSDMHVTGYTDGVQQNGTDATIEDCDFVANQRGVAMWAGSSGNTIQNNCFLLNTTQNAYDSDNNNWDGNYYDDYTVAGSYAISPGTAVDNNALTLNNSVVGQTTAELGETFTLDIVFTFPECDDTRNLAVYEFDVNYNASKLEFVSAGTEYNLVDIDPNGFFGPNDGGDALYTNIDGSTAGKVTFAASNFTVPRTETGFVGKVVFKALKANTSVGVWIGSIYRNDLGDDLVVGNTNHVITLQDVTPPTFSMTAYADDDNDPSALISPIDDTYSDGSLAGTGPKVKMYLDMEANDDYDLDKLQYSWDGGITPWIDWPAYTGLPEPFTLPAPVYFNNQTRAEGTYTFSVRAADAAIPTPNYSPQVDYTFTMDKTGPGLVLVTMTDADGCAPDPDYTDKLTVDVAFVDDGSVDIDEIEHTSTTWPAAVREAYAPAQVLLAAPDGPKTLYARLYDKWNNMGLQKTDAITLDQVAPTPSGWVLAGGAAKTSSHTVDGQVSTFGGGFEQNYNETEANVLDCQDGGWVGITTNPFDVVLSANDGVKKVYFATRDRAGNISTVLWDEITVDTDGPEIDDMSLASQNGFPCSPSWTVDVTVEWTDDDVNYLFLGSTTGFPLTTWHDVSAVSGPPYSFTVAYTITGGTNNDDNSVFAQLRDDILNYGAEASASIFVDVSNPGLSSIEMQDLTTASGTFSNDEEVAVVMSGSTDIKYICFSEDGIAFSAWEPVDFTTGSATVNYTFATPVTENAYLPLWAKVRDCSGRNNTYSDAGGIIFDVTAPVIGPISINSDAIKTKSQAVNVDFPVTEQYPMTVTMSEDATLDVGDATTVSFAYGGGPAYGFSLSAADNVAHPVYVQLEDQAGNFSTIEMDDIILDMTPPTGTIDIVSTNPDAAAEYTNTASCVLNITWDADVVEYAVANIVPTWTHVTPPEASRAHTVIWAGGWQKVYITFLDDAGNWGAVSYDSIYCSGAVPSPPTTFTAAASNSVDLEWSADPMDQYYLIKYNYNGDYPAYTNPNPPAPAWTEGFPATGAIEVWGTEHVFDGPHEDIYIFSIWTVNKCGTQSTAYTASNLSTDYILGDFTGGDSPDGCLDFDNEFFALAMAYDTEEGVDVEYNPIIDIAPTFCGGPDDYPMPDGFVDFEDFVIFGMNYRDYRCGGNDSDAEGKPSREGAPKPVVPVVAITADVPGFVQSGEEFSVALRATNAEAILGYHLVLNYDENLELVTAEPGAMHESVERAFFFKNTDAGVDIAAVALGGEFDGEEMTILSFRATADCDVTLDAVVLDVRDWSNKQIEVEFNVVAKVDVLIPTEFALSQNYPNPFNPSTVVAMSLPMASEYRLDIYNITGQLVESFSGYSEAGVVTIEWNATEYSSGIYLYRMEAGSFTQTKKMVLLK